MAEWLWLEPWVCLCVSMQKWGVGVHLWVESLSIYISTTIAATLILRCRYDLVCVVFCNDAGAQFEGSEVGFVGELAVGHDVDVSAGFERGCGGGKEGFP